MYMVSEKKDTLIIVTTQKIIGHMIMILICFAIIKKISDIVKVLSFFGLVSFNNSLIDLKS